MKSFKEYFLGEGIEQTKFGFDSDYPETPIVPEVDWNSFNKISEMVDYINETDINLYPKML